MFAQICPLPSIRGGGGSPQILGFLSLLNRSTGFFRNFFKFFPILLGAIGDFTVKVDVCMATGPIVSGGGGGVGGDGGNGSSRGKHRFMESKIYTRKSLKSSSKPNPSSQPPKFQQSQLVLVPTTDDGSNPPRRLPHTDSLPSDNGLSSLNSNHEKNDERAAGVAPVDGTRNSVPLVTYGTSNGGQEFLSINTSGGSKEDIRELRCVLAEQLEMVRAYNRKIEAREIQLATAPVVVAAPGPVTPVGYSHSQLSATGGGGSRKKLHNPDVGSLRRQLSVSVATGHMDSYSMSDATEKEKRTPKANQYYRNSDFLLAKDKIPPPSSNKKTKVNDNKKHSSVHADYGAPADMGKVYAQAFKSCATLLGRLMRHKHGWIFNNPVDVEMLNLHDYYSIIKHPMDLGTIKSRLNSNFYQSPREFAEDVRITFNNAMTYNPESQDAHIMAASLLKIFEEKWPAIEAEFTVPSYAMPLKKTPPPLDMRRILKRSESTTHPVVPDLLTSRSFSQAPNSARTPALKKPKAKDPHKREMTYDEKQKLSNQLQNLPNEKLDLIVQIIKKRNTSMSQHDDEIEVDIDSVDTETLWELDRFVTNYKKSLSKHKRKAELAMQARLETEENIQEGVRTKILLPLTII